MTGPPPQGGSNKPPRRRVVPEATGQAIGYLRKPGRFKFYDYVQTVVAPKPVVLYAVLDPDEPVRVPNDSYYAWAPGQKRPEPVNDCNFYWQEVSVNRRYYGYVVGQQALDVAAFPAMAFFNAAALNKAATNITKRFNTLMETVANWGANTSDANTLNGGAGKWTTASNDPASANYLAIQSSLLQAYANIMLATNSAVVWEDMRLIVSPGLAQKMARTAEIRDYLKSQVNSIKVIEGQEPSVSNNWGLPSSIAGLKVVVEDAPIVTSASVEAGTPATTTRQFVKSDTTAVICARPGGVEGQYGAPSFSTFQRYVYKWDLSVQARADQWNDLYESGVVDQYIDVLAAPRSGWLITNVA